ncbi:MAG: cytochrome c oxidase subunit 3 [Lentisphaeria bacterium]|jgi:heme/copper-type cytochrome/quinol oxidase subunit 3|nr:cytochrome c oxidase subunit 3 [Lentisphaeria bacterium]MDP7743281.1 cytochrome c oxidase subunit 3 [Lentisphaeria bacterium]|tara:strand:+ start:192 stop:779 length:588 start_codon:yes stop_codon:yes gene_type:complete
MIATSEREAQQTPVVDNAILAMLIVLAGEVMFFTGMISAYMVSRAGFEVWPPPDQPRLSISRTALNTALLLLSAPTMLLAVRAVGRDRRRAALMWVLLTLLLGTFFVIMQGLEWVRLIGFGLTTTSGLYGAFFYLIVGAHGLHAIIGLIILFTAITVGLRTASDASCRRFVRVTALYWIFVVALWPILYTIVYVL